MTTTVSVAAQRNPVPGLAGRLTQRAPKQAMSPDPVRPRQSLRSDHASERVVSDGQPYAGQCSKSSAAALVLSSRRPASRYRQFGLAPSWAGRSGPPAVRRQASLAENAPQVPRRRRLMILRRGRLRSLSCCMAYATCALPPLRSRSPVAHEEQCRRERAAPFVARASESASVDRQWYCSASKGAIQLRLAGQRRRTASGQTEPRAGTAGA